MVNARLRAFAKPSFLYLQAKDPPEQVSPSNSSAILDWSLSI
jgi:hypothetical protein